MAEENGKRASSKRRLLMEFEVAPALLPEEVTEALRAQLGVDPDQELPPKFAVLIPVGDAEGGYREVIKENARTAGTFRAPPVESLRGKKAVVNQLSFEDA